MNELIALSVVALTAGLFGSLHCVAMCGGLSGLFAVHQGARAAQRVLPLAMTYNAGRLTSYALLGLSAGSLGGSLLSTAPSLALPLRLLAATVMLAMAVSMLTRKTAAVERIGAALWPLIAPIATRLLPADTAGKAGLLGLTWGLLPCGLVYSVLLVTLAGADGLTGAVAMFAFGVGTMPAMLGTGLGAWRLSSLVNRSRPAAAALLVIMAVATAVMPAMHATDSSSGSGHEHHAHMSR